MTKADKVREYARLCYVKPSSEFLLSELRLRYPGEFDGWSPKDVQRVLDRRDVRGGPRTAPRCEHCGQRIEKEHR